MKRFLKNIALFFLVYLGLSLLISAFIPHHWGNPWYSVKISHLEKNRDLKYNTYFFGSSRVYRHINPSLFDSLMQTKGLENVRSYNLGAPGTFPPQTYFLYEQFLDSPLSKGAKFCFLELMDVATIPDQLMHQEKTNYWLNGRELGFVCHSILADETENAAQKFSQVSSYFESFLEGVFHMGHFSRQITDANYYNKDYLGPLQDGYLPLDYEYQTASNPSLKRTLSDRMKGLRAKPETLEQRKRLMIDAQTNSLGDQYDKVHQERILQLIQKSHHRGIELIFMFIAPKPNQAYRNAINLQAHLPDEHLIEITPVNYPELFTLENAFDIGHFNTQGVRMFTLFLADEFKEIKGI